MVCKTKVGDREKYLAKDWFEELRDIICTSFEKIELSQDSGPFSKYGPGKFERKKTTRQGKNGEDGGGGVMSIMRNGRVFEKVGVNFSKVYGKFPKKFQNKIPGARKDPRFWASGISVVMHMKNPHIPAMHFNTRFICTTKHWF